MEARVPADVLAVFALQDQAAVGEEAEIEATPRKDRSSGGARLRGSKLALRVT